MTWGLALAYKLVSIPLFQGTETATATDSYLLHVTLIDVKILTFLTRNTIQAVMKVERLCHLPTVPAVFMFWQYSLVYLIEVPALMQNLNSEEREMQGR